MSDDLNKDFDEIAAKINTEIQKTKCSVARMRKLINDAGMISLNGYKDEDRLYCQLDNEEITEEEFNAKISKVYENAKKINNKGIIAIHYSLFEIGWKPSSMNC